MPYVGMEITIRLTEPQVHALHTVLSLVSNDPDWAQILGDGGEQAMATLSRAHDRILTARRAARTAFGSARGEGGL